MTSPADQLSPNFKMHSVLNEAKTKAKGRPIYDDIEVVEIRFAGDRQKVAVFPAHEPEPNATRAAATNGDGPVTYAEVYSRQYRAFKERTSQSVSGTPLSELPFLTEGKRSELRALNIHTAEALAGLDGTPLKTLGMGGRELKNQAQAYLDTADATADTTEQAATIASLREQLAAKDAELRSLAEGRRPADGAQGDGDDAGEDAGGEGDDETRDLAELSDAELKAFIRQETSEPVRGNPSRETLLERAMELATRPEAE